MSNQPVPKKPLHKAPIELINKAEALLIQVCPAEQFETVLREFTGRKVRFLHELTEFELHRLIRDCEERLGGRAS